MKSFENYSYSFFYYGCKRLYLGAAVKKNRKPDNYVYYKMLSHLRGDYAVFSYRAMWLNYIKKINLIKRLYASAADMFFVTNRYERLQLLKGWGRKSGTPVLHYSRVGQFDEWFSKKDLPHLLDWQSGRMGALSAVSGQDFARSAGPVFFSPDNDPRDRIFLEDAIGLDKVLCITPADTDSLFAGENIIPLFGNNNNTFSRQFYMNLLLFCSTSGARIFEKKIGARVPGGLIYSKYHDVHERGLYRRPNKVLLTSLRRSTRSRRARALATIGRRAQVNFDERAGVMSIKKYFNYVS